MCAEDKDRWEGMLPVDGDEADMFQALKDRLKKRKEKINKKGKKEKKEHDGMGLQLLFGGTVHWVVLTAAATMGGGKL